MYLPVGGEIPENDSALDVVGQFIKMKNAAGKLYGYYGVASKIVVLPYKYGNDVWTYISNSAETANNWSERVPEEAQVHWGSAYRRFRKVANGDLVARDGFDAQFLMWFAGGQPNTGMAEETAARFWDECHRIALAINALYAVKTTVQLVEESLPDVPKLPIPTIPPWVWWMMYGMGGLWALSMLPKKGKR